MADGSSGFTHKDRVVTYADQKAKFENLIIKGCEKEYHDDPLTLASVAFNEAGNYSQLAQKAVCYAYLNRTENLVRRPESNNEISHFSTNNFLDGIIRHNRTLVNIGDWASGIISSIVAAMERLDASEPASGSKYPLKEGETDLVDGATHWVSPVGLKAEGYSKGPTGVCLKGVPRAGFTNCFPSWTQRPDEPNVEAVIASGVDKNNFMFFKGIRYLCFILNS